MKRFNYAAILLGSLALSVTMCAIGCGDSGDTTPSSSSVNSKTAGPVTVQLDSKAQEIIAANNITNAEYLFTDKDGKQVKLTSQQITPTNSSKKLGKAEAKDGRVDTKTTTITIEGVPTVSTEVVAVYYNDNDEIAALQCGKLDWTDTVAVIPSLLYNAQGANYTFDASAELIKKGDYTDLHVGAIPKDYVPGVTGQPDIDLTGLIEVKIDNKYFETKGNSDIIGRYYGKEYTTYDGSVASVNFKTIDGEQKLSTNPIFVTDRVLEKVTVGPDICDLQYDHLSTNLHNDGEYMIVCPLKTDKADYACNKKVIETGFFDSSRVDTGWIKGYAAVRELPIKISVDYPNHEGKGDIPDVALYDIEYTVTDRSGNPLSGNAIKVESRENHFHGDETYPGFATIFAECSKNEKIVSFSVRATFKPNAKNKVDKEFVSDPINVCAIYNEPEVVYGFKNDNGSYIEYNTYDFKSGDRVDLYLLMSLCSESVSIDSGIYPHKEVYYYSEPFEIPEAIAYYPNTYSIDSLSGEAVQGIEVKHDKGAPFYHIACIEDLSEQYSFLLNANEAGFALLKEFYTVGSFSINPATTQP